ncbi:MAG: IclR family transcriptional regulator [Actinomycetota bacterium]
MDASSGSYHSQGLSRGLAALRTLAKAQDPLSLATLAQRLDLPKSTLLRLLAVMEEEGFVVKLEDPPSYTVGPSVFDIAESLGDVDLAALTSATLKELANRLGFTANLGVLQGRSVLHLCVEEPERALRIAAGGFLDHTYCTGLGKVLLAALDSEQIDQRLPAPQPWESFTEHTITTRTALDVELDRVRQHGYSIDDEERNRGVRCMAVIVPTDAPFALALSVSGPIGEITDAHAPAVYRALTEAATAIARLPRLTSALESVRLRWGIA